MSQASPRSAKEWRQLARDRRLKALRADPTSAGLPDELTEMEGIYDHPSTLAELEQQCGPFGEQAAELAAWAAVSIWLLGIQPQMKRQIIRQQNRELAAQAHRYMYVIAEAAEFPVTHARNVPAPAKSVAARRSDKQRARTAYGAWVDAGWPQIEAGCQQVFRALRRAVRATLPPSELELEARQCETEFPKLWQLFKC